MRLRGMVIAALAAAIAVLPAAPALSPAQDGLPVAESAIYAGPPGRVALEGPWYMKADRAGYGALKGYQSGAFDGTEVRVPHVANGNRVTGTEGIKSFRGSIAWYRTSFAVPADGEYAIRFESVHHHATVWLDGRLLGRHTGVYLPFEYRRKLTAGRMHTLVVRADWRGPTQQKRSGWHRTWFNFGGINREVTVRPLGASEITAPTIHTRLTQEGAVVDVTAHVRNRTAQAREISVEGTLSRAGERHPLIFPALLVRPGETRIVHAQVLVPAPALWAPGSPNLYDLDLAVPGESAWRQRVGLRELRWRGGRMRLNGRVLRLHGASLHEDVRGRGDALTPEDMDGLVDSLKAIGANATRSQHQLNPALLERLDAAGIVVWHGLGPIDAPGAWTSRTPRQQATARRRVRETYHQTQAHPSIIAWNLANEVAGNGHSGGQPEFVDDMARWLHRRDPGRLVAVDVWGAHPPRTPGFIYRNLDAIAVTNYAGWYEGAGRPRSAIKGLIRHRTSQFLDIFRGKVTIISEFGAEGHPVNESSLPGGFGYQSWLVGEHIRAYRSYNRLSGMLVWNLRDFAVSPAFAGGSIRKVVPAIHIVRGVNTKGLFDYNGRPKPVVETVRQAYAQLGTGLR